MIIDIVCDRLQKIQLFNTKPIQKVEVAREVIAVMPTSGYKSNRKLFSDEQEKFNAKYLITASNMYYGLWPKDVRVLVCQCATRFNMKFLHQWSDSSSEDWLFDFILRNPILSLQISEATSLARATRFNAIS